LPSLAELEGCEIGELGHYEQVSFTTVSQQVDRICQLKLLKRGERPEDRCVHTVHLSQKGLYLVHGTLAHRRQWLAQIVATLSQEEQCQIAAALQGWFN
jgi:DNA-binding MarR family transcriptional regulator